MTCNLKDLPEKTKAHVIGMEGECHIIQSLLDMGVHKDTFVRIVRRLFFSSNYVVEVGEEYIVLREREAKCLLVST